MSVLIQSQSVDSAQATVYTNLTQNSVRIDKFIARNNDSGVQTLSAWVLPAGGMVGTANLFMTVPITAGQAYLCGELVGMDLDSGDSILVQGTLAGAISIRANGRSV